MSDGPGTAGPSGPPGPSGPSGTPGAGGSPGPRRLDARPVQLRGSRLARAVLRLLGWRFEFDGLPAAQGVMAVYPHTSNWDFPFGILAKWAMGIDVTFWAKASLFRVPLLGRLMRALGGVPVDRSSPRGMVGDMVERMQQARARDEFCWLVLAPEGTRGEVPGWKSGFYQVCLGAGVPLALAHIDFGGRRIGVAGCLQLGGDRDADMAEVARVIGFARGRRPQQGSPVRLR